MLVTAMAAVAVTRPWHSTADEEDEHRAAGSGQAPAAAPAAADSGRAAFDIRFTSTGLLAEARSVDGGPVIPVLGVRAGDLRDTYGAPRGARLHEGIDIGAPRGTPVAASLDGWIVSLSTDSAGGRGLHVLDRTGTWLLYYAHLDDYSRIVYRGLAVRRGELLGYVGTTGNADGWPHLHFEVARLGRAGHPGAAPVNAYDFLLRGSH